MRLRDLCLAAGLITAAALASTAVPVAAEAAGGVSAKWWVQPMVSVPATPAGGMSSISCVSGTSCAAVGGTVVEIWNGTEWAASPAPDRAGEAYFYGVDCLSRSACYAVGGVSAGSGAPIAIRWGGGSWTLQATPDPVGSSLATLYSVSCSSSTRCMAVGGYVDASGFEVPLAESYDGTSWTIVKVPAPRGATGTWLSAVDCVSVSACTAVGSSYSAVGVQVAFGEAWNGSSWMSLRVPSPAGGSTVALQGVSCPSAGSCVAVGSYQDSTGAELGLAETSSGSGWSIAQLPAQPASSSSALLGVSCLSTTACTAVGNTSDAAGMPVPLAVSWDGTAWSADSVSDPSGGRGAGLASVACESAPACHAVGVYTARAGVSAELAEVTHPILPTVTRNPTSVKAVAGQRVTFVAAATGTPQPTVAWEVSTNGGSSWTTVTQQTSDTYSFTTSKGASGHEFRALFTNVAGHVASAAATLIVS